MFQNVCGFGKKLAADTKQNQEMQLTPKSELVTVLNSRVCLYIPSQGTPLTSITLCSTNLSDALDQFWSGKPGGQPEPRQQVWGLEALEGGAGCHFIGWGLVIPHQHSPVDVQSTSHI